jgi:hypothetical protein
MHNPPSDVWLKLVTSAHGKATTRWANTKATIRALTDVKGCMPLGTQDYCAICEILDHWIAQDERHAQVMRRACSLAIGAHSRVEA